MLTSSTFYADIVSFFVTRKCQKIQNIDEKVNFEEYLDVFWTTWEISWKKTWKFQFSGKMWLTIILKITKNKALHSL